MIDINTKIVDNERVVFFDVDDTLVLRGPREQSPTFDGDTRVTVVNPYTNDTLYLEPHNMHINLLREHHARGYHVIVWSQAGARWANAVLQSLGLVAYVNQIMTKPTKYVDDLAASEWMGQHLYFPDRK